KNKKSLYVCITLDKVRENGYHEIINLNGEMIMVRVKVGITLTEDTLARLEEICKEMGLSKSQALSMLVNKEYIQKYQDDNKVFKA
ncbi:ribbon-helix-helix protein, CopG family, partial [Staphylococcus epidermidis]